MIPHDADIDPEFSDVDESSGAEDDVVSWGQSVEGAGGAEALSGLRISIVGRLAGMNRREAMNLLRSYGATIIESESGAIDWLIVGSEESPLAEAELIDATMRRRRDAGSIEVIREAELWQRLGLVDDRNATSKLYTPAMLAHLLGVSVRVIRRWHRRGLIKPVRTLHKLPYFDFQEVATARRLAAWVASGASPEAIERRLMELIEIVPNLRRPLDQLSILIEGKHVLLRQGEGLIEPGGQLRFDFDAIEPSTVWPADIAALPVHNAILPFPSAEMPLESTRVGSFPPREAELDEDGLLLSAYQAEDQGDLAAAVDYYHAILARDGVRADIHFQIGELLYRLGETIAARERYYAAIEVDPEYVEARSSLAGVLAETGQPELALAAYRGALSLHDGYSDVHYNLARILDDLQRHTEARHHWQRFLQLSPGSPWANEARERLDDASD